MPQKIYFGSVLVKDIRSGKIITIERKIYKEREDITEEGFKNYVLKHFSPPERRFFRVVGLCFDTAVITGTTNY